MAYDYQVIFLNKYETGQLGARRSQQEINIGDTKKK